MRYIVNNSMIDFVSWGESTLILNEILFHMKDDISIFDRLDVIVEEHFKGKDLPTDEDIHQFIVDSKEDIFRRLGL